MAEELPGFGEIAGSDSFHPYFGFSEECGVELGLSRVDVDAWGGSRGSKMRFGLDFDFAIIAGRKLLEDRLGA